MQEIIETIFEHLEAHWVKFVTAAAFMALGWYFGKRRARAEWRRKEFFDRLNVSLNSFRDGKLLIRTLLEKTAQEVFLNSVASETVIDAARKTTEENPILPLPEDDYWYFLNAVLNEVAEKFSEGQIRRDAGGSVVTCMYTLCLTSECAGDIKTRKVRAMLVQTALLDNLPEKAPAFEQQNHATRWMTLNQLAAARKKHPHQFLDVEICV